MPSETARFTALLQPEQLAAYRKIQDTTPRTVVTNLGGEDETLDSAFKRLRYHDKVNKVFETFSDDAPAK